MTTQTFRRPRATPHAHLAWVILWKYVEDLIGSGKGQALRSSLRVFPGRATPTWIVDEHPFLIWEEARDRGGPGGDRSQLTADSNQWDQWVRYGRLRRAWLEGLALKRLPDPGFPEGVEMLWPDHESHPAVVSDHLVLHNVTHIPEGEPGRFLIQGELEVANVEAVAERVETELPAGHRLGLDLFHR